MNVPAPSVPRDSADSLEAESKKDRLSSEIAAHEDALLPSIFLMTNSFETGGSERQFVALAGALRAAKYQVTVGCLQPKGPLQREIGPVLHFGLGGSLFGRKSIRSRYRLAAHLRRSDIAVAQAFDYYTNLTLIPAAKLARTPVVAGSLRQLGDLLTPNQWRAQLASFRWADCVVCNSEAAARRLRDDGFSENPIAVIGNGLPESAFVGNGNLKPFHSGFRVGMIARMNSRSKNHRLLLEAAARLRARLPNLEIVLLGDGPLRKELESLAASLGITEAVQFLGDRQDVTSILTTLDLTVLPSSSESLSNAILESMAAGVPVIGSDVGGNSELLSGDRGILVPYDDADALAAVMHRAATDLPLRQTLGLNARRFAQENFTMDRMRQKHEELYADLLERKGWRARSFSTLGGGKQHAKIRVAIVAASLRYVGGQSVQADLLLKHWHRDPDVHLRFIPIDPEFPGGLKWVSKVPALRTVLRTPLYAWYLWRGLEHVDVAHIFSASYWSFLVAPVPAWLVARLRNKKVLLHYHSGEARDHLLHFRTAVPMLKKMQALVVPSGYLVDVFREFGLRAEAIPNIVDFNDFSFRERRPLRPYLVCTRGFHAYYRVDLVVKAFAEVQEIYPEARLDLAGGGPLEGQIRELVSDLKLSSVKFLGVVSREEIPKVYDDADIFVNASSVDNMPVSVMEAFASGTPVVSTSPEAMPYLVDHGRTGLLSPMGDSAALAKNILRVLQEPGLGSRLAANAYEESDHYRWAIVREQWLRAYRALMQDSHESASHRQT